MFKVTATFKGFASESDAHSWAEFLGRLAGPFFASELPTKPQIEVGYQFADDDEPA